MDDWLTLDQAVDDGVVAPSHGEYVDRVWGIRMLGLIVRGAFL